MNLLTSFQKNHPFQSNQVKTDLFNSYKELNTVTFNLQIFIQDLKSNSYFFLQHFKRQISPFEISVNQYEINQENILKEIDDEINKSLPKKEKTFKLFNLKHEFNESL
jgi:hypothetical protein